MPTEAALPFSRPTVRGFSLDRMVRAVEKVRERLLRVAGALEAAGIAYAVAGGLGVAWR